MKDLIYSSLRNRYFAVAVILSLLILAVALFAHQNVTGTRGQTSANIEMRNLLLHHSRYIRDGVWQSARALESFLLDPDRRAERDRVEDGLARAQERTEELLHHPWTQAQGLRRAVSRLQELLSAFEGAAQAVIDTRTDATKQYPALRYARDIMLNEHARFMDAGRLAIEDLRYDPSAASSEALVQEFDRLRDLWIHMIATFRMYLANRLGSFNVDAMTTQETDIRTRLEAIRDGLDRAARMDRDQGPGLQASESLAIMRDAVPRWSDGFDAVQRIQRGPDWRTDVRLMQDRVDPLLEEIWQILLNIDARVERSSSEDVKTLNSLATDQAGTLWLLTLFGIVIIALGYVALSKWILRPIATVTEALKQEAAGERQEELPEARLSETRNLTEAFMQMRRQVHSRQVALEHQALHDALTDLPNRTLLLDRLQQAIFTSRRHHQPLALLMMDLDRFKEINDTLGHQVGDRLLQEVSHRLVGTLRQTDTVARLGGDEFALLLPNTEVSEARIIAEKTSAALEQALQLNGHQLYVGASIGIAIYPQHGSTAQMLLQRADVAMYMAKRSKSSPAIYDARADQHTIGRLSLMSDLRKAIDESQLELHYQPQLDVATQRVVAAEALLRWRHDRYGPIPPQQAISLAETTGLIQSLTWWVLERAIGECGDWQKTHPGLGVAVNLSMHNLQESGLPQRLGELLERHGLTADLLTLEITESAMMSEPEHTLAILGELDNMGVALSVDDFGTGFSSLAYLKQLPVDELKIDRSFVSDMADDDNDAVIVRSTIDLAHNLGLRVVAEGVEQSATQDLLEILRCDRAQGYWYSKPLPAPLLLDWLTNQIQSPRRAQGSSS